MYLFSISRSRSAPVSISFLMMRNLSLIFGILFYVLFCFLEILNISLCDGAPSAS